MALSNNYYVLASLLVLSFVNAQAQDVDITKYGAVSDGKTDSAAAILAAFKIACASPTPSNIVIPAGDFFMQQVSLEGPCKSPIGINLQGKLLAPADPNTLDTKIDWFNVRQITGFNVFGGGSMDGQGKLTWDLKAKNQSPQLMAMFSLAFVTNADIREVSFVQSKNTHVHLFGCKNITFTRITIDSPEVSPNTDGIKMGISSDITVNDSIIKSGDDCLAILSGTINLNVNRVTCGPGHGYSVGSMGGNPDEKDINGIHISNCTSIGTMNGVRIKSWGTNNVAVANDITFQDIVMQNVGNPIIIDAEYCPSRNCQSAPPSHVKISNIKIKNIKGTTSTQNAVNLLCSSAEPCTGVEISDVDLTFNGANAISTCKNVQPILSGVQNPRICASS